MVWKGLIVKRKKGPIDINNPLTADNSRVIDRPFVEKDPTVPQYVKDIVIQDINKWNESYDKSLLSGTVTGEENKVLTLTRYDGTILAIPFNDLNGLTSDDVINTANFNTQTGQWTFVTSEGVQITANGDGRYSLLGHSHPEYELTFVKNSAFNKNFDNNGVSTLVARSDHTHPEKPVVDRPNSNVIYSIAFNDIANFQTKWLSFTGTNVSFQPSTGFIKSDLLEGSNTGPTDLEVIQGTGVTILVAEGYEKKILPNGTFGIKFIANNVGVLVGALKPLP